MIIGETTCGLCGQPKHIVDYTWSKARRPPAFGVMVIKQQHGICLPCERLGTPPHPQGREPNFGLQGGQS